MNWVVLSAKMCYWTSPAIQSEPVKYTVLPTGWWPSLVSVLEKYGFPLPMFNTILLFNADLNPRT